MCKLTYYKLGRQWFLDLPEYADNPEDLERIGSFRDFLDMAAEGATTLHFRISAEKFEGANVLTFTGSSGAQTGAYYHLEQYEGRPVDMELWYNKVLYRYSPEAPQKLYLKRITPK